MRPQNHAIIRAVRQIYAPSTFPISKQKKLPEEIKTSLSAHYDIDDDTTHFHIEYQPIDFQQHKLKNSIDNH
ncbi:MAG: hypothetical protein KF816_06215 [Melioribacteraceae bacterium]|nr:hypothetical protein [Melioribacteraceae bacterium]